jgi:hypothetical protein
VLTAAEATAAPASHQPSHCCDSYHSGTADLLLVQHLATCSIAVATHMSRMRQPADSMLAHQPDGHAPQLVLTGRNLVPAVDVHGCAGRLWCLRLRL